MSTPEPVTYVGRVVRFVRLHDRHNVRIFATCEDCGLVLLDAPTGPGAVSTLRLALHELEHIVVRHEEHRPQC